MNDRLEMLIEAVKENWPADSEGMTFEEAGLQLLGKTELLFEAGSVMAGLAFKAEVAREEDDPEKFMAFLIGVLRIAYNEGRRSLLQ